MYLPTSYSVTALILASLPFLLAKSILAVADDSVKDLAYRYISNTYG